MKEVPKLHEPPYPAIHLSRHGIILSMVRWWKGWEEEEEEVYPLWATVHKNYCDAKEPRVLIGSYWWPSRYIYYELYWYPIWSQLTVYDYVSIRTLHPVWNCTLDKGTGRCWLRSIFRTDSAILCPDTETLSTWGFKSALIQFMCPMRQIKNTLNGIKRGRGDSWINSCFGFAFKWLSILIRTSIEWMDEIGSLSAGVEALIDTD